MHGVHPTFHNMYQIFLHFLNELSYGYRRFEGNGKVEKKFCPVGCLSLVLLNWDSQQVRTFYLPSQRNFPISFKPKVAIAELFWNATKNLVFHFEGERHASFPRKPNVKGFWKENSTFSLVEVQNYLRIIFRFDNFLPLSNLCSTLNFIAISSNNLIAL